DRGMQELYIVMLENGDYLSCSPRHRFLVDDNGTDRWVEAKDLTQGMAVRVTDATPTWSLPINLEEVESTNSPRRTGSRLEELLNSDKKDSVGRLLGRLAGSGTLSK